MKPLRNPVTSSAKPQRQSGPWGQGRRLEFIDFRLQWDGRINRSDLMNHFGISVPQASADIASYSELAPRNLSYDKSARVYIATPGFAPVFPTSSAEHYLTDLLALTTNVLAREECFIGWAPSMAIASSPARPVPAGTLVSVLRAIRSQGSLEVLYQSMSRPQPTLRRISPHGIAHDGFRWHVRAYCHSRKAFRDFVFARMLETHPADGPVVSAEDDHAWSTTVNLVLVPSPGLSPSRRRVVELDYAMTNGQAVLETRQAMLYYVLQRLGLSRDGELRPEAQQIQLKNHAEVKAILERLAKSYD